MALVRATVQHMPPRLRRSATTAPQALSTTPEPTGRPRRGNSGWRIRSQLASTYPAQRRRLRSRRVRAVPRARRPGGPRTTPRTFLRDHAPHRAAPSPNSARPTSHRCSHACRRSTIPTRPSAAAARTPTAPRPCPAPPRCRWPPSAAPGRPRRPRPRRRTPPSPPTAPAEIPRRQRLPRRFPRQLERHLALRSSAVHNPFGHRDSLRRIQP